MHLRIAMQSVLVLIPSFGQINVSKIGLTSKSIKEVMFSLHLNRMGANQLEQ